MRFRSYAHWLYTLFICLLSTAYSQNLTKENSWSLTGSKKNLYFDQGVFFYGLPAKELPSIQKLKEIRSFFDKRMNSERIVLDIDSNALSGVYGYISKDKNKIYIDLYQTEKSELFAPKVNANFLKSVDVYLIEPKLLSLELSFNQAYSYEVFYLANPTRVVIDVKK